MKNRRERIFFESTHFFQCYPADIYWLKVNSRNTRARCELCLKLTIKTPQQRQWSRSGVFIINFEHTSHFVVVFPLLTSNM